MPQYYVPSGKLSPIAYLLFSAAILIVFPLLGLIYSYAIWYIPIIYFNVIITIILGVVSGYIIKYMILYLGKVRNPQAAIGIGIIACLILYYFSWVVYVDLLINMEDSGGQFTFFASSNVNVNETIDIALSPSVVFSMMGLLYDWGSWGIFGITASGYMLALVWIGELFIITMIAVKNSYEVAKLPFCEFSNTWFKEEKVGPFVYVSNRPDLIGKIENSDPASFDELQFTKNDQRDHTLFKIYDNKEGAIYLTAESHKARIKEGKLEFDITPFIESIQITDAMKQKLLEKMSE